MIHTASPRPQPRGRGHGDDFADALISDDISVGPLRKQTAGVPAGDPAAVSPRTLSGGSSMTLVVAGLRTRQGETDSAKLVSEALGGLSTSPFVVQVGTPDSGALVTLLNVLPATLYPGVPVWSRVYPQHWFANGYLSIIDVLACGAAAPAGRTPLVTSGDPQRQGPIELTTSEAADVGDGISKASIPAPALAPEISSPAPDEESPALSSNACALAMAVDHVWAERLVRLARDSRGITTVWLRDYSLNESAVESLVETMKREARRDGVTIDRVMVNGREMWRADLPQGRK